MRLFQNVFLILLIVVLAACSAAPAVPATATLPPTAAATATVTPIPPATPVPTPQAGMFYVDPQASLGPISPYLYGTNYGPFVAIPASMLEEAYAAGMTIIRFPGGAWGDRNDLKPYHIDGFMQMVEKMGATATISVRLREVSPEKAAELVRYVNLEKGYNVRYWSIGNEPTLYGKELQRTYDTAEFNQAWRETALAMRAVDPSILLLGPELHGDYTANEATNPKDSLGKDWMIEFLRANGDLVDVVTFHRYPYPQGDKNTTVDDLRLNAREWDDLIPYVRNLIHTETGRDLPIGITELNTHWNKAVGTDSTPDSLYNALWLSAVITRMARNGVFLLNHWLLTSQGGMGAWGLISTSELRPSYYTYQLYKQFGSEQVYSSSDDPDVAILAARRSDGALTVLLTNLGVGEVSKPLTVAGGVPATAEAFVLDAQHNAESIGMLDLSSGSLTLPAQSVVLLVFQP